MDILLAVFRGGEASENDAERERLFTRCPIATEDDTDAMAARPENKEVSGVRAAGDGDEGGDARCCPGDGRVTLAGGAGADSTAEARSAGVGDESDADIACGSGPEGKKSTGGVRI